MREQTARFRLFFEEFIHQVLILRTLEERHLQWQLKGAAHKFAIYQTKLRFHIFTT